MSAARRRLALVGGTTTWGDCIVAARYLLWPRGLVHGANVPEYEQAFARALGVRHSFTFSSGRVGLYALLRTLWIGPGDEVLLQVPTHVVVSNAIRYAGACPVHVDCRFDNYNMDLEQAEERLTARTR